MPDFKHQEDHDPYWYDSDIHLPRERGELLMLRSRPEYVDEQQGRYLDMPPTFECFAARDITIGYHRDGCRYVLETHPLYEYLKATDSDPDNFTKDPCCEVRATVIESYADFDGRLMNAGDVDTVRKAVARQMSIDPLFRERLSYAREILALLRLDDLLPSPAVGRPPIPGFNVDL